MGEDAAGATERAGQWYGIVTADAQWMLAHDAYLGDSDDNIGVIGEGVEFRTW